MLYYVFLVNCCDDDKPFLMVKYMPNDTLVKRIFHCMYPLNLRTFSYYILYAIETKKNKCDAYKILAI